jgi:hypothetical protein
MDQIVLFNADWRRVTYGNEGGENLQGSLTNTECPVNINAAAFQAGTGQIRLDSKTTLQDNQRQQTASSPEGR